MITLAVRDISRELAKIRKMVPDAQTVMKPWMLKNSRALVSSSGRVPGLVQVTPPHSQGKRGKAAQRQGESAVMADISKVYGTPGQLYEAISTNHRGQAGAFYAAVKRRDWKTANAIAHAHGLKLEPFDDGAAHSRRRNGRTGRVSGKNPSLYVADRKWIVAYIKAKQKLVGLLIAAVVGPCESRLGRLAGVPGFARRQNFAAGSCTLEEGRGITIRIVNLSKHATSDLQRRFNYVLGYRLKAMARELPYLARQIEKKSGLKVS